MPPDRRPEGPTPTPHALVAPALPDPKDGSAFKTIPLRKSRVAAALCQSDEVYKEARIPLVVTYDSDADAAYIYLEHPVTGVSERIVPFDPREGMFNLDIDHDARVIGLEILGARRHLPPALLGAILSQAQVETEHPQ